MRSLGAPFDTFGTDASFKAGCLYPAFVASDTQDQINEKMSGYNACINVRDSARQEGRLMLALGSIAGLLIGHYVWKRS